jgi:SAM-dependent methyltransferase
MKDNNEVFSNNRNELIGKYCYGETLHVGSSDIRSNLHDYLQSFDNIVLYGLDIVKSDKTNFIHNIENPLPKFFQKFDTVILGEVLEHTRNPYEVLINVKNSLKDDGNLIITTPNARAIFYKANKESQHKFVWDNITLERLLKESGYKIMRKGYVNTYQRNLLLKLLCNLRKNWSWHLIFVVKKLK